MSLSGWDRATSPYHSGEQELHERLGRKERQERTGRMVHRPFMPDQHRRFFAELPFFVVGTVDDEGWPWASLLFGAPGFVSTPDARTLDVRATPVPGDPLGKNLKDGAAVGFVGIELPTRRRNRVNGVVRRVRDDGFAVDVVQSYGNCPQYIQTRQMAFVRAPEDVSGIVAEPFTQVDEPLTWLLRQSDTLFVASVNDRDDKYDTGGADVNHRGGRPGFVKVEGDTLTIPDFRGNFAFNTLGNFVVNPRAGLLLIDFESGDLWQLTGTVDLLWEPTDEVRAFRGAQRAWRFHLDHGVRLAGASPLRGEPGEASPNLRDTGTWDEDG